MRPTVITPCMRPCPKQDSVTSERTSDNNVLREIEEDAVRHGALAQVPPDVEQGIQQAGAAVQQLVLEGSQVCRRVRQRAGELLRHFQG